jgi:hypothetical protein
MGSLRDLVHNSATRKNLKFFGILVPEDSSVDAVERHKFDRIGTYRWTQGSIRFTLDVYTDTFEDGTFIKLAAQLEVDGIRKYVRYAKRLVHVKDRYAEEEKPAEWGIEQKGVYAIQNVHPDFPHEWKVELLTE